MVALGLFERAEDQTFVPTKELREVEIERAIASPGNRGTTVKRRPGHWWETLQKQAPVRYFGLGRPQLPVGFDKEPAD